MFEVKKKQICFTSISQTNPQNSFKLELLTDQMWIHKGP